MSDAKEAEATVLLVDDDRFQLQVLRLHFRREGFHVLTAESGEEALRVLAGNPVDAVVADVLMPHMDGYVLARSIREIPGQGRLPLVLVSPDEPASREHEQAMASGAQAIVGRRSDAGAALRAVQRLLTALAPEREALAPLEFVQEGVLLVDEAGRLLFANEAASRLTGWTRAEMAASGVHGLLHGSCAGEPAADGGACPCCAAPQPGGTVLLTHLRTRAGGQVAVRHEARPAGSLGPPESVLITLLDMSRVRDLEEQLRVAQAVEAFGQLAGGVAHAFNNLLTPILGNVSLVRDRLTEAGAGRLAEPLADAERAGRRAADLVEQILAFGERPGPSPRPTDLAAIVEDVGRFMRRTLDRTIGVGIEVEEGLSAVRGDPALIHQVLLRLALASRDSIRSRREREPGADERIVFAARNVSVDEGASALRPGSRPGLWAAVSVVDNGAGMERDATASVVRALSTADEAIPGPSGPALEAARAVLGGHRGWVEFDSDPDRGTTATLFLPATAEEVERITRSTMPALPRGSGRVLLVDDDALVRALGRRLLEAGGYDVHEAENGLDALADYRDADPPFDLVVLDLSMPVMSGEETLGEFLEMDPDARVILWSGWSHGAGEGFEELGARAFIAKPFDSRRLLTTVAKVLAG